MTAPVAATFRLLDGRVGWDPAAEGGLTGAVLTGGVLGLAPRDGGPPDPVRIAPAGLARGPGGVWWLLAGRPARLLRLDGCAPAFRTSDVVPVPLADPRAVRAAGRCLALLDGDRVLVVDVPGERLVGDAVVPGATALLLTPGGTVFVGDAGGRVHELDRSGLERAAVATAGCRPVAALAVSAAGDTVVVLHERGTVSLVTAGRARPGTAADVAALPPSGVEAATDHGFRLAGRGTFDRSGAPLAADAVGPASARFGVRGQLLTARLDSGLPRCRWHRVRVDADVPAGTRVTVGVATTDDPEERPSRPSASGPWAAFPGGPPHPEDWQDAPGGATDFLVTAPPGRYAFVRVRLEGDGTASPTVHAVRLDLPRATSRDLLPAAYADDPRAADFTERLLAVFDAELEVLDEALRGRAALLDPGALPDDALGWLAAFLGLGFEAAMSAAQRRDLLAAAPELFRRRGTPAGLVRTLRVALGVEATVEELGPQRPWAALDTGARLGSARLFGRSTARVRLGSTVLGHAPLQSRGDPDDDARLAGAHRFRVHVAPTGVDPDLVRRAVRSQSPAHTEPVVRVSSGGFRVGAARAGIDTALLAPEPAVTGRTVLGRTGVLRPGRRGSVAVAGLVVLDTGSRTAGLRTE